MLPHRAFALVLAAAITLGFPVAFGTTVIPPTLDELVERSDRVVRAEVVRTRCVWRGEGDDRYIATIVSLAIKEAIVGETPDEIELEFYGGEIDGERYFVFGQTQFAEGDEDILFVSNQRSALTPLVRMMYGRYIVAATEDGERFIARSNGLPLASSVEIAEPMDAHAEEALNTLRASSALTPEAFATDIRAAAGRLGRTDVSRK